MKKFLKFLPVAVVAVAAVSLTACSDDDDDNNGNGSGNDQGNSGTHSTENVYVNGNIPASVGIATIKTNDNGQVTEIASQYEKVTFEYGNFTPSRADHNYTVLMKVRETEDPADGSDFYIEVNEQGFATYVYQVYTDIEDGTDQMWFEYKDGLLIKARRTDGASDETFTVTYSNGDIATVTKQESDGDHSTYTFNYTNTVENKGNIFLPDEMYEIDLDEFEVAAVAGLLGKTSKNLPMGYEEVSVEGHSTYTYTSVYHWEFNSDNLPVKFWENNDTYDVMTFTWK